MTAAIIQIIIGILLLMWGADRFVFASRGIAVKFHISPLIAGVLLVGFGNSFPELVVSFIAAYKHHAAMAVGNVVGSNIANIGLVLGVAILVRPLIVAKAILKRDLPILFVVMLVVFLLLKNLFLSRVDGLILIGMLILYLGFIYYSMRSQKHTHIADDIDTNAPTVKFVLWWLAGLALLFVASELLVRGASTIAVHFGMSDLLVGLTVVALGTSLPELATTVVAAYKNHTDIAVGNVIGSNIFNLLAVLAMPALLDPHAIDSLFLTRDYLAMTLLAFLLLGFCFINIKDHLLKRWQGIVFLGFYIGYIVYLIKG